MKVLGIVCSPRLHGNTEILVQAALDSAQKEGVATELVTLAGKSIAPCDSCYYCMKTGQCHIQDDMQDIYPRLLEADGIIFGTPVYFYSVCAQAKALIDRTYLFRLKRDLRNKVAGAVIVQAGSGAIGALNVLTSYFTIQKMIMVGRAIARGGPEKGVVKSHERGMAEADTLGKIVAGYLKTNKIPAIKEYYIEKLVKDHSWGDGSSQQ